MKARRKNTKTTRKFLRQKISATLQSKDEQRNKALSGNAARAEDGNEAAEAGGSVSLSDVMKNAKKLNSKLKRQRKRAGGKDRPVTAADAEWVPRSLRQIMNFTQRSNDRASGENQIGEKRKRSIEQDDNEEQQHRKKKAKTGEDASESPEKSAKSKRRCSGAVSEMPKKKKEKTKENGPNKQQLAPQPEPRQRQQKEKPKKAAPQRKKSDDMRSLDIVRFGEVVSEPPILPALRKSSKTSQHGWKEKERKPLEPQQQDAAPKPKKTLEEQIKQRQFELLRSRVLAQYEKVKQRRKAAYEARHHEKENGSSHQWEEMKMDKDMWASANE